MTYQPKPMPERSLEPPSKAPPNCPGVDGWDVYRCSRCWRYERCAQELEALELGEEPLHA